MKIVRLLLNLMVPNGCQKRKHYIGAWDRVDREIYNRRISSPSRDIKVTADHGCRPWTQLPEPDDLENHNRKDFALVSSYSTSTTVV